MDLELDSRRGSATPGRSRLLRDGVEGNARLTALTAAVLLVLLAAEGATIPWIHSRLTLHIFLGVLLIPVVIAKMATTAWRFARYYLRAPGYVEKGPPPALLRIVVAPLVVASTAVLFGTGVLLLALHPQRGLLVGLHKSSFIVWFAAMSAHVLGHALRVPGLVRADVSRALPGSRLRQYLVGGAIVAGMIAAVATLPLAHDWVNWAAQHHRHEDG
jgi:hypothetical protein